MGSSSPPRAPTLPLPLIWYGTFLLVLPPYFCSPQQLLPPASLSTGYSYRRQLLLLHNHLLVSQPVLHTLPWLLHHTFSSSLYWRFFTFLPSREIPFLTQQFKLLFPLGKFLLQSPPLLSFPLERFLFLLSNLSSCSLLASFFSNRLLFSLSLSFFLFLFFFPFPLPLLSPSLSDKLGV